MLPAPHRRRLKLALCLSRTCAGNPCAGCGRQKVTGRRAPQRRGQCGWAVHGCNRDEVAVCDAQRQVEQQRECVRAARASAASAMLACAAQTSRSASTTDGVLSHAGPGRCAPKDHGQAPGRRRDDVAHEHGGSHKRARSRVGPEDAHARRLHGPAPAPGRHAAKQVPAVVHQEQERHPELACARPYITLVLPQP